MSTHKGKTKLYLDDIQLRIIRDALEAHSRLALGQLQNVLFDMVIQNPTQFAGKAVAVHSPIIEEACIAIKKQLFDLSSPTASYSIVNEKVSENVQVAWEMMQVIRHHLAWRASPEGGLTIDFDEPLKITKRDLIVVEDANAESSKGHTAKKNQDT